MRRTTVKLPDRGDPRFGDRPIALIVDAGPLYAYVDADDVHHASCLELLESHPGPLAVPNPQRNTRRTGWRESRLTQFRWHIARAADDGRSPRSIFRR
jgi:hypothetical protein